MNRINRLPTYYTDTYSKYNQGYYKNQKNTNTDGWMTTWREEIEEEMEDKDSFDNVVFSTLTEEQLDEKFNGSYGIEQGIPFLLWTKTRVYFPVSRAGAEWVGSVPRDPSDYEDLGYF